MSKDGAWNALATVREELCGTLGAWQILGIGLDVLIETKDLVVELSVTFRGTR